MGEQATLIDNANLGAGTKRSIEGDYGYRPAITPETWSTCSIMVHGEQHVKTGRINQWELFFNAKPGAGACWIMFPDDDTVINQFVELNDYKFPAPTYRSAVKCRVLWRRAGRVNVVRQIELLPEDTNVTTPAATKPSELDEAFPRDGRGEPMDDKPAAKHWIDGKENQSQYWGAVGNWARWIGIIAKDDQHAWSHKTIGVEKSTREFGGPMGAALEEIARAALRQRVQNVLNRPMTLQDFIDAIGYKTVEMAWKEGQLSDGDIRKLMDDYLASDKHKGNEPQTQQPASTGQETAKSGQGVSTPTPPTKNATAGKSDGKKDSPVATDKKDEIRDRYNSKQRGNDYLMVQGRVLLFRMDHPDWTLETDMIGMTDDAAVFKATIRNAEGRIIATGHGRASEGSTKHLGGRWVEKAETAALGRALALAGYGTDDTLDDSEYISDTPLPKAG